MKTLTLYQTVEVLMDKLDTTLIILFKNLVNINYMTIKKSLTLLHIIMIAMKVN